MHEDRLKAVAERSSYVENVLRHRMIAELSSELWAISPKNTLQVFNSEVDDSGFDIVLKVNSTIRYVQLKQAHDGKVPPHCSTRLSFSKLAGSCIVLLSYGLEDLTISGYRFFGAEPNLPMLAIESFKPSRSPGRRNAEGKRHVRAHYRDVPVSRFTRRLAGLELLSHLFPQYNCEEKAETQGKDQERIAIDPFTALAGTWAFGDADKYIKELREDWE